MITKHFTLYLILVFLNIQIGYTQNSYAKKIVAKLSAKKMQGRGYVDDGDLKAANYIIKEFEKIGLQKFKESYFQKFSFPINTQPSEMSFIINDTLKLTPGAEYLINPSSPSIKGSYPVLLVTTKDLLDTNTFVEILKKSEGKILLIDTYKQSQYNNEQKSIISETINYLKYNPDYPAVATVIFTNQKLTWSSSTYQLSKSNFTVQKKIQLEKINKITLNCHSEFKENYTSQNCIGYINGSSKSDSTLVISAHYDHLGKMGKNTYFPGANDNASGVSMLLNLAKYYAKKKNKPKNDIIFIAFGGEEIGLLGSKYYTENPLSSLEKIKFMINFDLAGTGNEGIKVVNGTLHKNRFDTLKKLNAENHLLTNVYPRGTACNSDHCYFNELHVPVFYIYTLGGIKAYHDIYDIPKTLKLTEFENYLSLMKLFINNLQNKN